MLGDKARPSEYNGLMLVCSKGGLSGANEPSGYALGDILLDGSVEWAVKKHSAYLEPGEILLNAGFSADDGVLITDDTFSNEIAQCFVAITDSTLKAFTLTCRFETSLGRTDDRSIKVKVGSR